MDAGRMEEPGDFPGSDGTCSEYLLDKAPK